MLDDIYPIPKLHLETAAGSDGQRIYAANRTFTNLVSTTLCHLPNDFVGPAQQVGGRGGIRTHGRIAPTPNLTSGALDHSATPSFIDFQRVDNNVFYDLVEYFVIFFNTASN
jgi:hypothetical protein